MPNRIFLFGEVGTGKSTICAAISLYFFERKGWTPRLNLVENAKGTRYLQDWVKLLRKGQFPPKTDKAAYERIDVGFLDRQNMEQVGFTFFEVSGENLRPLDPTDKEHAKRNVQLDSWLDEADTILLVGSANPRGEHDRYALQNFLEYMLYKKIDKPTALVISEWDKLDAGQRNPIEVASSLYGEASKLLAAMNPSCILPFSIGEVRDESVIVNINYMAGTDQLISWILRTIRQSL